MLSVNSVFDVNLTISSTEWVHVLAEMGERGQMEKPVLQLVELSTSNSVC